MCIRRYTSRLILLGAGLAAAGSGGVLANDSATMAHPVEQAAHGLAASTVEYTVPDIKLIRDDGKTVSLRQEMNDGRPVVLNFIFTSCGSICPLMSQIFAQFQNQLGPERDRFHLMSISTDPEQDTPARLVEYARQFDAGPEWQHYTGSLDASLAAQRAFDIYRGDKMSHTPVTLLRVAPGQPWRRIDGFVSPDELMREYRGLLASR